MAETTGDEAAGPTYGEAAKRLETILNTIEGGRVDIDELSGLVGEAATLVTLCRNKIQEAEMQVRRITEDLERAAEAPSPAVSTAQPASTPGGQATAEPPARSGGWSPPPVDDDDLPF